MFLRVFVMFVSDVLTLLRVWSSPTVFWRCRKHGDAELAVFTELLLYQLLWVFGGTAL
jgi:hypothetical protein